MAKNQPRRLTPAQIQTNKNHCAALKAISHYAPANPAYRIDAIQAVDSEVERLQHREAELEAAQAAARDDAVAKEWELHNLILGARHQVTAQYGEDSDEAQSVGLKKRTEYKPPGRKSKKDGSTK